MRHDGSMGECIIKKYAHQYDDNGNTNVKD